MAELEIKTYVLLDALNLDVPIYQQVGENQRVKMTKMGTWAPYLQITFQDNTGVSKTIRYKETSKYVLQEDQIEKEKIPANTKWTTRERQDRIFRMGTLTTNKKSLQAYLEAYPAYDKFDGISDDYPQPCYKLLNKTEETKIKNSEARKRVQAANKIFSLSLEEAQALIIRLNGAFAGTPTDAAGCENVLIDYLDECDEEGVDQILRDTINKDEEISILIGRLLSADKLSFTVNKNQVSRKVNGKWVDVKEISDEYDLEQRKMYLSEFLTSENGKLLLDDLKKDLETKNDPEGKKQEVKGKGK